MPDNHNAILPLFSPMVERPKKRYYTIVADPPWGHYTRFPRRHDARITEANAYPLMANHEVLSLPVGLWAEDRAHLYLWCVNSNIDFAHDVMSAWGFDVNTVLTWVKGRFERGRLIQHIGLGYYYRNSTEHVLFGVRGKLPTLNNDMPTAFIAPRTGHSEKPSTFYDIVEHMSPGPYLDVFARKQRMGWDTFGNEAFNFGTELPPEAFTRCCDLAEAVAGAIVCPVHDEEAINAS